MLCANENEGIYAYSNFPSWLLFWRKRLLLLMVGLFCSAQEMCKWTQNSPPFYFSPPSRLPLSTNYNMLGSSVMRPTDPRFSPQSRGGKGAGSAGKGSWVGFVWVTDLWKWTVSITSSDIQREQRVSCTFNVMKNHLKNYFLSKPNSQQ